MTSVIDKKTKKINDKSTLDRENFMFKFIKTRYFLKEEQSMYYFTSEKNSKYIHKKLKKHDETNKACEFLKEFENISEVHESHKEATEMSKIQSFECNEHCRTNITRVIRAYQTHDIQSYYIDINNEKIIILYDSKSVVNYISTDCKLRLKAFNRINVIEQNDKKIIIVLECNNLSNIIFRKRRNNANYLMISTTHLIKLSLNILKENDDLKEKKLRSYTSIKSIHIMKITLNKKKVITIIHRDHKESYMMRNL